MNSEKIKTLLPWALAIFIAIVFVQSLFYKFSNTFETQHSIGTIGEWMEGLPLLNSVAEQFAAYGGYTVGSVELVAALLLIVRKTQFFGALLSWAVISGAIFFHLFTPLGVSVVINELGERDGGQLFAMACGVWFAGLAIMWIRKSDVFKS